MPATTTPGAVRAVQSICLILGGLLFWATYELGRNHHPFWVAIFAIVNSPGLTVLWHMSEGTSIGEALNLKIASWAFVLGDLFCLPLALFGGVWGAHNTHLGHWRHSVWFLIFSIVGGLVIGYAWHTLLDGPNYRKNGEELRLNSRSKCWHDYGTYGSLGALLLYFCAPLVISSLWWHWTTSFVYVLLGLIAWGFLGYLDGVRGGDNYRGSYILAIFNLHPAVTSDGSVLYPLGVPTPM